MSKKPTLMLIDGLAVFYRAYHAIAHLTNAEGMPTGAVYGFASMLLKAYSDIKPDYVVLAWDKARTAEDQRMKLYPQYKAKRAKMADDFYAQIPYIRELSAAMGMPMLELDGYEADDIIGTIIRRHPELRIIVVSNDRDTFQLLDGHVEIYMQRRGMTETELMDAPGVREKYGIEPHQIIDWKALAGDASDNIPGVAGVGDKTAISLLQKYGTLEKVYENLDEIPGKLQDRLRDDRENALLSQKLATIMDDAPVELDLESARTGRFDRQKLHELFRHLGFKSLLAKLPPELQTMPSETPSLFDEPAKPKERAHLKTAKYQAVTDARQLAALVAELEKQPAIAIDTETDGLDANGDGVNLVGLSISFKEGEAYYVPVGHTAGTQLTCDLAIEALKPVLENLKIGKVGHNIKFDYEVLSRYGVKLALVPKA
jgi:DNA polymerase-1